LGKLRDPPLQPRGAPRPAGPGALAPAPGTAAPAAAAAAAAPCAPADQLGV